MIYGEIQKDTFYIELNNYETIYDTSYSTVREYRINREKVSISRYNSVGKTLYYSSFGQELKRATYESYKRLFPDEVNPPVKVEKTIKDVKKMNISSEQVPTSVTRLFYEVNNNKSVLFDAASGRVTTSGYFPNFVRQLSPYPENIDYTAKEIKVEF